MLGWGSRASHASQAHAPVPLAWRDVCARSRIHSQLGRLLCPPNARRRRHMGLFVRTIWRRPHVVSSRTRCRPTRASSLTALCSSASTRRGWCAATWAAWVASAPPMACRTGTVSTIPFQMRARPKTSTYTMWGHRRGRCSTFALSMRVSTVGGTRPSTASSRRRTATRSAPSAPSTCSPRELWVTTTGTTS